MGDYTELKSSREELLKKAGYAEPHILYRLVAENSPQAPEIEGRYNGAALPGND